MADEKAEKSKKCKKHKLENDENPGLENVQKKQRKGISESGFSGKVSFFKEVNKREIGYRICPISLSYRKKIESSFDWFLPIDSVKGTISTRKITGHGAVFNLEFSPDDKYLVAACEMHSAMLFDPHSQKKVGDIMHAHTDSVNCVTFLDIRTFATCSDDKTISLWDIRNTKKDLMTLKGHKNWVKSINFFPESKQLISSAFDDTVRVWDINKFRKNKPVKGKKIMNIPYLTRTKISVDKFGKPKLIAATTTGVLFVVHNLCLKTLMLDTCLSMRDLHSANFNENDFAELNQNNINMGEENRIEFIPTFAPDTVPWCIASVQVHPKIDSILSRYTTRGQDNDEWTTVHTLKEENSSKDDGFYELESYIEESNLNSDYIKELCYNNDGRLVCSPFGNGVRILSCYKDDFSNKQSLKEIKYITGHRNTVLTTKFATHLNMFASGCLDGQVSFYKPKF
ncbi:DDB1- and CUL4-associated factor 10-like [Clytia hemisphaerica]|uniref:Uncharacterized protein n=1 Tax=Clytia hemisphaerica TaxID=252671 RepID=A0A7M5X5V9_9CNID